MAGENSLSANSPLTRLKGTGEKTAKLFETCDVRTIGELLHYMPRDYDSFGAPVRVADFREGMMCAAACTLVRQPALRHVRRYAILTGEAEEVIPAGEPEEAILTGGPVEAGTPDTFKVTWFNQPWLAKSLYAGRPYILRGYVRRKGKAWLMEQPAVYSPEDYAQLKESFMPRYPLTAGLKNKTVIRTMRQALLSAGAIPDILPQELVRRHGFMEQEQALRAIHFPGDLSEQKQARRRLAYEEFLLFLLGIRLLKKSEETEAAGIRMESVRGQEELLKRLPYALTGAQTRVLDEILSDMQSGRRMHRLIQGDVGSGKTILALLSMLTAAENGYQAALMAPTQVLAAQHYETFRAMSETYDLPVRPILLSGSLKAAERREALEKIRTGEANCVIGTNALMQESVTYHRLGLVITDEQHRFGVRQREILADKGDGSDPDASQSRCGEPDGTPVRSGRGRCGDGAGEEMSVGPHILVMSATPIPRTLAMILYGDLEVSILDELPAGRKKIRNALVDPSYREKAYAFLAEQAGKGRQAYVICPMVEEGELAGAENVTDYAEKLRSALPADVRVDILHGRMKAEEKDAVMERFAAHDTDILVSTTVVEVGVNVPNATVMMIENAERFGLASLHQLRGRVGRGDEQSYCIFVNTSPQEAAAERLNILTESNDGFEIADMDLKLRGPGDLFGVRQSGALAFKVADIYADADLLTMAAADADALLQADPSLEKPENLALGDTVRRDSFLDFKTL